tara:strand:- start:298 stop:1911 length:1614 start_codon:yes stop_codon:yes gene_type:complete
MNNYQEVVLEINKIISSLEDKTFDHFKTKLNETSPNINIKEYDDSNLIVLSNSFTKKNSTTPLLEKECKSIILDKESLEVVCYTYDDIFYNQDAKDYILQNGLSEYSIQECFEGTLLSFFHHNNKWNIATRQCIDAKKSIWTSNKSYYDLFMDCIDISFDEFTNHLKPEFNYYFVLVHHDNKNIVDYTDYFGNPEYKEIIHVLTRDRKTQYDIELDNQDQWTIYPNFKTPTRFNKDDNVQTQNLVKFINNDDSLTVNIPENHENFNYLDELNKNTRLALPVKCEGLVVKVREESTNKLIIMKFQTNSYQFMSILKPNNNNIYMSFLELYQQDLLKRHLEYFPGNSKLTMEGNMKESYDTIGVVDASFKVITSELFEIFRYLYDLRDCSHKNEEFYKLLPNEYTVALYKIRGIYYRKKEKFIKSKNETEESDTTTNQYNHGLKIFDIYNMLKKKYEIKDLLKLFRARKLIMATYQNQDTSDAKIFNNLSNRCDKVSIKMIAIFLNKMFPKDPDLDVYTKVNAKSVFRKQAPAGLSVSI